MSTNPRILEGVKTNGKITSFRRPAKVDGPSQLGRSKLASLIAAYAPHDGSFDLPISGLHASRYSRVNSECVHALGLPSLCIAAQERRP